MSPEFVKPVETPIGQVRLCANEDALTAVFFEAHGADCTATATQVDSHPILDRAETELEAYFETGHAKTTTPMAMRGTDFQKTVWCALLDIPSGETATYGELARRIGNPAAVRAVGLANSKNPLSIFVPCHRVVGANGKLTGYAGGLAAKRWLLEHERSC